MGPKVEYIEAESKKMGYQGQEGGGNGRCLLNHAKLKLCRMSKYSDLMYKIVLLLLLIHFSRVPLCATP